LGRRKRRSPPRNERPYKHATRGYLHEHGAEGAPARFDVVAVMLTGGPPEVQHYENAFWAD
jgi:hypothetical protein